MPHGAQVDLPAVRYGKVDVDASPSVGSPRCSSSAVAWRSWRSAWRTPSARRPSDWRAIERRATAASLDYARELTAIGPAAHRFGRVSSAPPTWAARQFRALGLDAGRARAVHDRARLGARVGARAASSRRPIGRFTSRRSAGRRRRRTAASRPTSSRSTTFSPGAIAARRRCAAASCCCRTAIRPAIPTRVARTRARSASRCAPPARSRCSRRTAIPTISSARAASDSAPSSARCRRRRSAATTRR